MEKTNLIKFDEIACLDGIAAVVTFDNPKALNALTLEMFQALHTKLTEWKKRDDVRLLFMHSSTDKAFCAGGDVKTLALKVLQNPDTDFPEQFFWWEYATDLLVRDFPKPIIVWLDGLTMGGGLGIATGASHKIVTEKSQLAMPELNIGFFPDVGAAYFLNQLPEQIALFLAWTGARLNGADALHLKLADFSMPSKMKEGILHIIAQTEWAKTTEETHWQISNILGGAEIELPPSRIAAQQDLILRSLQTSSLEDALIKYLGTGFDDAWLKGALESFRKSSPLAAHATYQHFKKMRGLSCDKVLAKDFSLAVNIVRQGDFKEGIRATLIDKTHDAKWKHKGFGHVPQAEIDLLFRPLPEESKFSEFLRKSQEL